jgi:hypothetical protein
MGEEESLASTRSTIPFNLYIRRGPLSFIAVIMIQLYSSAVSHGPYYTSSSSYFCELRCRQYQRVMLLAKNYTFSCQVNNTLAFVSPDPDPIIAIPLYRYFISVSCESCDRDLTTAGISVPFVELRIVISVCRDTIFAIMVIWNESVTERRQNQPWPPPSLDHMARFGVREKGLLQYRFYR